MSAQPQPSERPHHPGQVVPRWLRPGVPGEGESRWPAATAAVVAVTAQAALPESLLAGGRLTLLIPEIVLGLLLIAANPVRMERAHPAVRAAEIILVGFITAGTMSSAGLLCRDVVTGRIHDPEVLLLSGGGIYAVNVLAFGLWYWQLDGGGPVGRLRSWTVHPDFLFAQMSAPDIGRPDWRPIFGDYLYLSLTNVTAFSPTDTLPLARWAKAMMAAQALTAFVLVALVLARAVNILAG